MMWQSYPFISNDTRLTVTVVPFPLFHGTSTAFLPSILKRGLGAFDPVSSANGVRCLTRLLPLADRYLLDQETWQLERIGIEFMVKQCVTNGNMNFRHGSTYCSPSEATAVRYALSNSHGSELLSSCIGLYRRLSLTASDQISFFEVEFPEIYSLSLTRPVPVLIVVQNVPGSVLRTEQGSDAIEQIYAIASANHDDEVAQVMFEQFNFELTAPIPSEWLVVKRIESKGLGDEYELLPHDGGNL